MKDESKEIIGNPDHEVFTTNEASGYLQYAGERLGWHVISDTHRGDVERCHRLEVRETGDGFQIHNVSFERATDWRDWRERRRELKSESFQSSLEAVQHVKDYERGYWGAVTEDLQEQRERERIEAGHELASLQHRANKNQRDIVDMSYDDGLSPKAALELERHHRLELASEFRQAAEALRIGVVEENRGYER